jgi:hypothetical protein
MSFAKSDTEKQCMFWPTWASKEDIFGQVLNRNWHKIWKGNVV